ncbi:hypothetical protein WN55_09928 [Dufourea novaeangliae]|uniref:Uncharacterized protein n=1 Tax=Dufourea novaeangliae TaxID=178035 RepID=A0A154PV61_DUFNO|nr:hypothetical protein WN55_09928 [Dufourea novaeangliae]
MFQESREELRLKLKVQQENKRGFNRNRRKAPCYREEDLVAIKRTQSGPGLKFAHKYFGPYKVTRALRNDRYIVEKVGEHEGPRQTPSSAEFMKPWLEDLDDLSTDSEVISDI